MKKFYRIWYLTLGLKLIMSALLPISADEAYYWVWSNHLDLSYFDHPPLISYLIYLGHMFQHLGQGFRWPTVILGHCTYLIWYQILEPRLNNDKKMNYLLWFFMLNPLIGWGSLLALPDTPVIFFWSLGIYFLLRYSEKPNGRDAAFLGASLGLGFLSKYHIVLFLPPLFFWLWYKKKIRELQIQHLIASFLTGILFSLPVLIWNYRHDFESFRFQLDHGLGREVFQWKWPLTYLAAQVGLLFPTTIYLLFRPDRKKDWSWLYCFGLFPILFFLISSFKAPTEGNWPILGYPCLLALAIVNATSAKPIKGTFAIWILAFGVVMSETYVHWIPFGKGNLKTEEFSRYDVLLKAAQTHTPFYASSFQMASQLSYKLQTPIYKLQGLGRKDFYDYLEEARPRSGTYYVAVEIWDRLPVYAQAHKQLQRVKIDDKFSLIQLKVQ